MSRSTRPELFAVALLALLGGCMGSDEPEVEVDDVASSAPVLEAPPPPDPYAQDRRTDSLGHAAAAVQRGQLDEARSELDGLVVTAPEDELGSIRFLRGWVFRQLGAHGQAHADFLAVSEEAGHPLQLQAVWLAAESALAAGKPAEAVACCAAHLDDASSAEPESGDDDDSAWIEQCRLVRARSRAQMGQVEPALNEFSSLLALEEDPQRAEHLRLEIGATLEQGGRKADAVALYKELYLQHEMPLSGAAAADALERLAPASLRSLSAQEMYTRAVTLRETGREAESHGLYEALRARADLGDPDAASWGERLIEEEPDFLWRNRRYSEVGDYHAALHAERHSGRKGAEHAYWAVQGYSRSGRWAEAIEMQLHGMEAHGGNHRFKGSEERLALLYMGGARYAEAREAWELWAKRSRRARRSARVRFNIAYSAYRAGDLATARDELAAILEDNDDRTAARFYLGKVEGLLGDAAKQRAIWDDVLRADPDSWHAQVIRSRRAEPGGLARDGRWPAEDAGVGPMLASHRVESRPPPVWLASRFWSHDQAMEAWADFADRLAPHWPELRTALELSRLGLDELSGPIARGVYEEIIAIRKEPSANRAAVATWELAGRPQDPEKAKLEAALGLEVSAQDWTMILSGAGVPNLVAAFADDWVPYDELDRARPDDRRAFSLRYPAAFAADVWRVAGEYDVDPLLLLAVMRAESMFKHDAVSRVGARGLVQVMPATGARVAALAGFEDFRVERLTEPGVNLRVGAWYLGQLLDRFGPGGFPLAIGSYNGGPHNIGRWLTPKLGADLEDYVEEIPFDETRRYIKKVVQNYAIYSDLYGDGLPVRISEVTKADDPSVINF